MCGSLWEQAQIATPQRTTKQYAQLFISQCCASEVFQLRSHTTQQSAALTTLDEGRRLQQSIQRPLLLYLYATDGLSQQNPPPADICIIGDFPLELLISRLLSCKFKFELHSKEFDHKEADARSCLAPSKSKWRVICPLYREMRRDVYMGIVKPPRRRPDHLIHIYATYQCTYCIDAAMIVWQDL